MVPGYIMIKLDYMLIILTCVSEKQSAIFGSDMYRSDKAMVHLLQLPSADNLTSGAPVLC